MKVKQIWKIHFGKRYKTIPKCLNVYDIICVCDIIIITGHCPYSQFSVEKLVI